MIDVFRTLIKDSMALYQHSAHCSSALQWFLDENPEYWPFIPIKTDAHSEGFVITYHRYLYTYLYRSMF